MKARWCVLFVSVVLLVTPSAFGAAGGLDLNWSGANSPFAAFASLGGEDTLRRADFQALCGGTSGATLDLTQDSAGQPGNGTPRETIRAGNSGDVKLAGNSNTVRRQLQRANKRRRA